METEIEIGWKVLVPKLEKMFDASLDIQGILFLIGVQELGHGPRSFSKNEKMDVIHVAICAVLEPYGYYELKYRDSDDWPHYKETESLPKMNPSQQLKLIKKGILDYFEKQGL